MLVPPQPFWRGRGAWKVGVRGVEGEGVRSASVSARGRGSGSDVGMEGEGEQDGGKGAERRGGRGEERVVEQHSGSEPL